MCSTSQKRHFQVTSLLIVYFCPRAPQLIRKFSFRTISVEDTHSTLAVIPVKVEVNNFLILLLLQTHEKNLPSFRSCSVYNSLINHIKTLDLSTLSTSSFIFLQVLDECLISKPTEKNESEKICNSISRMVQQLIDVSFEITKLDVMSPTTTTKHYNSDTYKWFQAFDMRRALETI